jgi:hypothetical protein
VKNSIGLRTIEEGQQAGVNSFPLVFFFPAFVYLVRHKLHGWEQSNGHLDGSRYEMEQEFYCLMLVRECLRVRSQINHLKHCA